MARILCILLLLYLLASAAHRPEKGLIADALARHEEAQARLKLEQDRLEQVKTLMPRLDGPALEVARRETLERANQAQWRLDAAAIGAFVLGYLGFLFLLLIAYYIWREVKQERHST